MRIAILLLSSAFLVFTPMVLFAGGGAEQTFSPPSEDGAEVLPELAAVGGVQDVWPFTFGLNDNREAVREVLGEPLERERTGAAVGQESPDGPQVEYWYYDGLVITFYIDEAQELEYVLTVSLTDPDVELGAGLSIGMPLDRARGILGEPALERDNLLVYFYYNTTIEVRHEDSLVVEMVLARALP